MVQKKEEQLSLGEVLNRAISFLKRYNVEQARLDAEILLSHVLKKDRIELYVSYDLPLSDSEKGLYRKLLVMRARGKPVAYLVEEKEFMSLKFKVNDNVLIPRPETEFLVEAVLDEIKSRGDEEEKIKACEIGTGSGAVSVSTAYFSRKEELNLHKIYALDYCRDILDVAEANAQRHGVEDLISFYEGDLLEPLSKVSRFSGSVDIIFSNPPYISKEEMENLQKEITHEPAEALDGGESGLDYFQRIIEDAPDWLGDNGAIFFEIGAEQKEDVTLLLQEQDFTIEKVIEDYSEVPRVIKAYMSV